jgi:hypothetical protein
MDNQTIALQLTIAEVNVILRSLGKHPFEEIAALIQNIKAQGEAQLAQITPTPTSEVEQSDK